MTEGKSKTVRGLLFTYTSSGKSAPVRRATKSPAQEGLMALADNVHAEGGNL